MADASNLPSLLPPPSSAPQARAAPSTLHPLKATVAETVTILTAKVRQAKTHRPGESVAYGNAKQVTGVEVEVDGIDALSAVLTRLEQQPHRAVIRGGLKADVAWSEHQRRLLYPDTDEKTKVVTPPTLEERPRRWLCIDLDRLACPEHLDPADDPEEAVRWVLEQLPEWLRGVTCHWQWSSSAGIGEAGWAVLKLHLWFWLTAPLEDRALRSWARLAQTLIIDPALYSAAQLHYTAAPVFEGLEDPLAGRRSGLYRGWKGDAAEPPDELKRWRELEEARRQEAQLLKRERPWDAQGAQGADEDALLRSWVQVGCEDIRQRLIESKEGSRHYTLRSVCGSLANYVTWGMMTEAEVLDLLGYSPILHESGRGERELEEALEWTMKRARANPKPRPILGRGRGGPKGRGREGREQAKSGGLQDSSARSVGGGQGAASSKAASRPRADQEHAARNALSALTREAQAVAATPRGEEGLKGHDTRLFQAAVYLGGLVAGGLLTEAMVREELTAAAAAAGLENAASIQRELTQGLAEGRQHPRRAPDVREKRVAREASVKAEAPLPMLPLPSQPLALSPASLGEEGALEAELQQEGEGSGGGEEDAGDDDGGPLGASWPDSDEGLAARLLRRRGEHLRYVPRLGWLVYEGGRWCVEGPDGVRVRRWALESASMLRAEVEEARPWGGVDEISPGERALWKARAAFARSAENAGKLASAVAVAELFEEVAAEADDLNRDDMLLCCKSGVIDLRTGRQTPHTPEGLHTAQSTASYDPAASCPAWEKFLLEIMGGDADMVAFLRRAVGYTLTGRLDEQCFFLLHGDGSNGKSVFTHILQLLLGTYGNTAQFTTFAEQKDPSKPRPDLARLLGARFVTAAEPSASLRLDEGVVKQITGGDRITARFLHQNDFEFSPKFKLWLSTNILPKIRGADHGIWRRVRLIPFNVQFRIKDDDPPEWPQADPGLKDRLVAELPGIFAWAVRGCLEWLQSGLCPPAQVLQATDAYRTESDNVLIFLQERCRMHADYCTPTTTLFDAYIKWCEESGIDHRLTSAVFGKRLARIPQLTKERGTGGARRWRGLRLLTEAELRQEATAEEEEDDGTFF